MIKEICAAGLDSKTLRNCLRVARTVRAITPDGMAEETAIATQDGGMVLEFTVGPREVAFAISANPTCFFVARHKDDFRKAGMILEETGITGLARWLVDAASFPTEGLIIGGPSSRGRNTAA